MLEQQQIQLVNGLQILYKQNVTGERWSGAPLKDSFKGHPLTHDILEKLGVLKLDAHANFGGFEDDLDTMQQRLIDGGAELMQRQGSVDSESDHGQSLMSFLESESPQSPNDAFGQSQLPTPPVLSQTCRSESQHLLQGSYMGSPASVDPSALHESPWAQSPINHRDTMDFLQPDNSSCLHSLRYMQPCNQSPLMVTPELCTDWPDWTDDDLYAVSGNGTLV
ncbi:hypothetical protein MMC12_002994 [Toensbergia leucococca]|nr:hypothetical protein [Toensbergia leucococca]